MRKQQGISLTGLIFWLAIVAFVGLMAAKLLPAYIEFFAVKKIFATMEKAGSASRAPRSPRRTSGWSSARTMEMLINLPP